ncbi:MAG TPA: PEP/pyruvate-binding domain-containing protein, partial [Syntrophorhabdaceae bacterium]
MDEKLKTLNSIALQVNLERTAAFVEIPEKYGHLLRVVQGHYGVSKRTTDLLLELNHPYVNWEYVLKELRTLSIGDFYEVNLHEEGLPALRIILTIYFDVIESSSADGIKDTATRYLFDFVVTIIENSREYLARNLKLFPFLIESLEKAYQEHGSSFRKASTYLKAMLKSVTGKEILPMPALGGLLFHFFRETYLYWLTQPDPSLWLTPDECGADGAKAFGELIEPLSHRNLQVLLGRLEDLRSDSTMVSDELAPRYIDMPDNSQIVNGYFLVADNLERSPAFPGRQHIVKLDFLFNMMGVPGLSEMHTSLLQEINRCLRMVFKEEDEGNLNDFVKKVFALLRRNVSPQHSGAVIDCITTLAKEVYDRKSHPLVDTMIGELVLFGFQRPEISGSTAEWQVKVNPAHIVNIRSWLGIIALRPRWAKRLLSALIINLKIGGVFVRDTDLLQKDISGLLNSDIQPAYNLVKQLLRIFPIYFTEIGAEGELRETSTKLDELSQRNDKLVYFLRKQSHVESNSLLVTFIEDVFRFWYSRDKNFIRHHLPQEVFDQIKPEGEYFEGLHTVFTVLFPRVHGEPREFLEWDGPKAQREILHIKGVPERDRERAALVIRLYQLLYKKYNFLPIDLLKDLESSGIFSIARVRSLRRHIHRKNYFQSLVIILGFLTALKERILSPKKTTYFENIYHKRHIAAGIPSMYGTYQEEKFEAVGLSFRLENYATTLFEELIQSLNLKFITKSTLTRIHKYLWLYVKALELEGVATEGLVAKMKYITSALQLKQFSVDQYIDIFQFISKGIRDIIKDYYIDAHSLNLPVIIRQVETSSLNRRSVEELSVDREQQAVYQASENFFRSIISSSFGLQVLDNLVNAIIRTLKAELEKFKDNKHILNLMMAYTPELAISPIYKKTKHIDNQILIGNKGYFLKELASFNFPIPPGFILTTEVFRSYDAVVGYKYIFNDMAHRINSEVLKLEKTLGKKYGDPENPLLLSVRSGATISLPGMMHSFLNVGINEEIAEGLSKKKGFEWAAWDSYRRYLQTYGMFENLDRNFFDRIISDFKFRYNIDRKIQFNAEQMRQIALSYRRAMEEKGVEVIDDPALQLQKAILQVFASWYSDQANIYRREMHISNEWGTAVIVQAMIYGNLNEDSGSGVIFTRDPKGSSSEVALYGDFIFGVQGDDIVSGLVETYPISANQRIAERRESPISLQERFPEIYRELVRLADVLIYEKGFHHQEIEFTFETPTKDGLHILQTRDMTQTETKRLRIFRDTPGLQKSFVGAGIGVSGGALSGRAVYSEEEIKQYRSDEPDTKLILIRPDTVSEDVGVILQVDGILTAKGGGTSHAAVTIPQLNKVGVVGFNKLRVYETEGYSLIDGHRINGGDL